MALMIRQIIDEMQTSKIFFLIQNTVSISKQTYYNLNYMKFREIKGLNCSFYHDAPKMA